MRVKRNDWNLRGSALSLEQKTVRELQELALDAPIEPSATRRKPLSRAARLDLIDMLSRWSGPGLALLMGAGVYLAVTAGRAYPGRAAAWGLMLLCALWVCRQARNQFRAGSKSSARPFRWRASYTACLSVLGVAFASAPILLTPTGAPHHVFLQAAGLTLFAGSCVAILNAAHLASAAAIAAPSAILVFLACLRSGDAALTVGAAAAGILCVSAVFAVSRNISAKAAQRHPRSRFLRREIKDWRQLDASGQDESGIGHAAPAQKAL